jgi:orotate phosphoribosyltransferase
MGADPITLAVAMTSDLSGDTKPIQAFVVRKEPKGHGRGKRIEGNFNPSLPIVVVDDVITTGDSTLKAAQAIAEEGGKVAFALVLVDRQEGGRENLQGHGIAVVSAFTRAELVD